jgi:hypothetical protein
MRSACCLGFCRSEGHTCGFALLVMTVGVAASRKVAGVCNGLGRTQAVANGAKRLR